MTLRRALKYVALTVAVVLVLGVGAVGVFYERLPSDELRHLSVGSLSVSGNARGAVAFGHARLTVTKDTVRVERAGRVVWSNDPGHGFVTAVRGSVSVRDHRGYFWPAVHTDHVWVDQTITSVDRDGNTVIIEGDVGADDSATSYRVRLEATDTAVVMSLRVPGADAVSLLSGRSAHAGVHGFGEQFTDFDLDGKILPLLDREQGVGRGQQPITFLADLTNHGAGGTDTMTYAAWPSFVTDDLRGERVAPSSPGAHAFAVADMTEPSRVGLQLWHESMTVQLTTAPTPEGLVRRQQAGTARARVPAWSQDGVIVGLQGGTKTVRHRVRQLRDSGVRVAGVWLQDWVGQRKTSFGSRLWWTWQLDRKRYPDWKQMVGHLHAKGIRVTTYVNPFLVDSADKPGPHVSNLYREAKDRGYLVKNPDGKPYGLDQGGFTAYLVDLTNPAARRWFARVIATDVLGVGADGFMADFGEGLPFDAVLHSGKATDLHNAWPGLWQQTVTEACKIAKKPHCLTWFRSGSLGSSPALAWNGDQLVDFGSEDGLASTLLGTFSAGVSGWPVLHSDIGGYTSIDAVVKDYVRTPELLERWAEVTAFGPVMRTHETNRPSDNIQSFGSAAIRRDLARMTAVFVALKPYRAHLLEEAAETGLPVIRHGWLVAPGTDAAQVDTQFFLGDDVLVAPVLSSGAREVSVTFPPGKWRNLFSGKLVEGDVTRTVPAPIGRPAAYVRASSPWAETLVAALKTVR